MGLIPNPGKECGFVERISCSWPRGGESRFLSRRQSICVQQVLRGASFEMTDSFVGFGISRVSRAVSRSFGRKPDFHVSGGRARRSTRHEPAWAFGNGRKMECGRRPSAFFLREDADRRMPSWRSGASGPHPLMRDLENDPSPPRSRGPRHAAQAVVFFRIGIRRRRALLLPTRHAGRHPADAPACGERRAGRSGRGGG